MEGNTITNIVFSFEEKGEKYEFRVDNSSIVCVGMFLDSLKQMFKDNNKSIHSQMAELNLIGK